MLVSRPQGRALLSATAAAVLVMLQVSGTAAQTAPGVYGPSAPALAPAAQPASPVASPVAPAASDTLPARAPAVRGANAPALLPKPVATNPVAANPVASAPVAAKPVAPNPVAAPAAPLSPPPRAAAVDEQAPPVPATPAPVNCPGNPNALGVARTVEIDTTGGPGFGFEHFKAYDFLRPGEVVLTFDDGPWPRNTPAVLAALANHCTKATFFPIGKHTIWHPEILRQVAEQGHTIGSHTWSHAVLSKKAVDGKAEIEKGASAVHVALGAPAAPFFRFPALQHPPEMLAYVAERNIAVFSCDVDSFDFKTKKPEDMVKRVMARLQKTGKGIILMHDFQAVTGKAMPMLLDALKAGGYRVVHIKAKDPLATLPEYDAEVARDLQGPVSAGNAGRPASSVVRTIDGY
jgi:peptidoglycan/xylan/chitin deacetylase (PgdA/CDA1 family)